MVTAIGGFGVGIRGPGVGARARRGLHLAERRSAKPSNPTAGGWHAESAPSLTNDVHSIRASSPGALHGCRSKTPAARGRQGRTRQRRVGQRDLRPAGGCWALHPRLLGREPDRRRRSHGSGGAAARLRSAGSTPSAVQAGSSGCGSIASNGTGRRGAIMAGRCTTTPATRPMRSASSRRTGRAQRRRRSGARTSSLAGWVRLGRRRPGDLAPGSGRPRWGVTDCGGFLALTAYRTGHFS